MSLRDNIRLAIQSTEEYLRLLGEQKLGVRRVDVAIVQTIDPEHRYVAGEVRICAHYRTALFQRLSSDQIVTYVESHAPNRTEALVIDYDRRTGDLQLAFKQNVLPSSPGHLEVDLRWLVRQQLGSHGMAHVDVLNVHQAQGREWDAVVFSTVDGTLPLCTPFFTSSRRREGAITLNTAISRVRKALYIVCERGYWRARDHELLSDLVRLAEDYGDEDE
ncbi:hypothetical protein JW916_01800 [Candidatus Sumerlaeota bacterium]|nr:hypothetical protein [Candidatus Sumerlaeota bacterium]